MLRIGSLTFDFPVVQAALSGYSDAPMRLIARRFGAPYALHQVVLDKSVAMSPKGRERLLGTLLPEDHPVGGQLMGAEAVQFADAAAIMAERGYDVVDINFGCPVKKVLGRKRGGYLLSDPPTAIAIIRAVRDAVPQGVPVTLKMRRGLDRSAESERNFFRIFDAALETGLDAIAVHGRTVKQQYRGPSDWGFLARVKRYAGDATILGSGDLYTAEDIRHMLEETGVDGVTAARGCIGNPWLFRDARAVLAGEPLPPPPSVPEQGEVMRAHFALSAARYGERRASRVLRKTAIRYTDLHPQAKQVRQAFVTAATFADLVAVLDEWYAPGRVWPAGVRKTGPGEVVETGARG